jgi:hypothetical protein
MSSSFSVPSQIPLSPEIPSFGPIRAHPLRSPNSPLLVYLRRARPSFLATESPTIDGLPAPLCCTCGSTLESRTRSRPLGQSERQCMFNVRNGDLIGTRDSQDLCLPSNCEPASQ